MESSHTSTGPNNDPNIPQEVDLRNNIQSDASTTENLTSNLNTKIPTDPDGTEQSPSTPSTLSQESDSTATASTASRNTDKNDLETVQEGNLSRKVPTNTNATEESPNQTNSLETQCPPEQVMEWPAGEGDSKYRIPSHVFERGNTSGQMDWSNASYDSLFSIQMGNMSFTKDQLLWMSKSGNLELDPTIRPSMELWSRQQSVDVGKKSENFEDRIGQSEVAAAETMKQVIVENEADKKKQSLEPDKEPTPFAFPILAGQVDKNASVRDWPRAKKQQVHASQPSKEPPKQSNVKLGSEKKQTSGDQLPNQKAASDVDKGTWSCFSCWPFL